MLADLVPALAHDTLDDRIADYKLPARVEFLAEFPRSEGPHGEKIRKDYLRERARSE